MRTLLLVFATVLALDFATPAQADEVYTFVVKKQEEKAKTRWSLSNWLDTRDRMRMMDLWLALHSPTPYEFFLSGSYVIPSATGSTKGSDLAFAAFATIFGLEGRRESVPNVRYHGLFDLRIFGYHDQGTNITFQAGVASQEIGGEAIRNAVIGGRMDIYLARFFGVGGLYRHYFDSVPNSFGVIGGNRYEGQAFIDFKFLRVFGTYFSESLTGAASVGNGVNLGLKLYF